MAGTKATTLTLRIDPAIKEGLRAVAAQEHRSLANMIEVMILDYCGRHGVAIPEQGALFNNDLRLTAQSRRLLIKPQAPRLR